MSNFNFNDKKQRSLDIYRFISNVKNLKKKNLLRGYSVKDNIIDNEVDALRKNNSLHDCMIIGAALKGKGGLLQGKNDKKTSQDLYLMTSFPSLPWKQEVCYTTGYINSVSNQAVGMLNVIKSLSKIEDLDSETALNFLLEHSVKYGASNFLSYKLAYLRSARDLSSKQHAIVSKIENEMSHREGAGFHFSALENVNPKMSLFMVAQRRVSGLIGKVEGEFRKAISLSNLIPTPINLDDVSGYLLRATQSCLLDTIHSLITIFNLDESFDEVKREFIQRLDKEFLKELSGLILWLSTLNTNNVITDYYKEGVEDSDASLSLYRVSSVFLERPSFAQYRNKIDKVIGIRLLSDIVENNLDSNLFDIESKKILMAENGVPLNEVFNIGLDTFYRTYVFLGFICNKTAFLSLSSQEISYIFENTQNLETLLTENEMRTLYITAPKETKSLVTVLALALFRRKSIDPDVDFEFRNDFISYVKDQHEGSIVNFINSLMNDCPEIASYIVVSLDEVTLEKMYTLVTKASEASQIRCEILRLIGKKLNRIEYIIEADAITTRTKVSKLQQYFDSSRIYVDSISMKKWLDSNPTISTEQYRNLYPRLEARISSLDKIDAAESNIVVIHLIDESEYLISQIAKDAFEQFCLNTEFGIQSYLGRRIRHNTLDGVTTDTVDAVLRKPEHRMILSNQNMLRKIEEWMSSYKSIVDKLRRDHLQFKSSSSLFNATLDSDEPITSENIRLLTNSLRSTGGSELLNDLVIAFCWKQITPQLENAARFIRTSLLQEAKDSIDKFFPGTYGTMDGQIRAELHEAVNEVFKKVSDWFQVPQTGFISASVRELCQIILIDLNRQNNVNFTGESLDVKYTGISVHRLYDCLAVLLQNAHKHGEDSSAILIDVNAIHAEVESVLELVKIDVISNVSEDNYIESKLRIFKAIDSAEAGSDMVTEGYTGIKKIKFITRLSEGEHTMRCLDNKERRELTLGFSIHAETATDEVLNGGSV